MLVPLSKIQILSGYRSRSGAELVSAYADIREARDGCNGGAPWAMGNRWFLLDKGEIREIANNAQLVDAGDYDGDGESELLFWSSIHVEEGYILRYDHLKKSAEFIWPLH